MAQTIKRDAQGWYYMADVPEDDEVQEDSISVQVKKTMEEVRAPEPEVAAEQAAVQESVVVTTASTVPDEIKWPEPKAKKKA